VHPIEWNTPSWRPEATSVSEDQPVADIVTCPAGKAVTGLNEYDPKPLKLAYEQERFGKTIILPMAAYCPFCKNEFGKDRHDRLVVKSNTSDSGDYCFDLDLHIGDDGEPYMKCQRCGGTTKKINPDPGADADRLHELTRQLQPEVQQQHLDIKGAIESFGSILMPMSEFKRIGLALAKDPTITAVARVDDQRLKIDWTTLRTKVKAFKRGRDDWPGVETRYWTPY
jgi:hypothetical protein